MSLLPSACFVQRGPMEPVEKETRDEMTNSLEWERTWSSTQNRKTKGLSACYWAEILTPKSNKLACRPQFCRRNTTKPGLQESKRANLHEFAIAEITENRILQMIFFQISSNFYIFGILDRTSVWLGIPVQSPSLVSSEGIFTSGLLPFLHLPSKPNYSVAMQWKLWALLVLAISVLKACAP